MLTLLFFVLLTTVLVSLEIIRYEQAKGRVNHLAVGAVENLMADYQPDMANWYDIYTLDMDYLGQGKEVANNRVWNYLENNLLNVDLLGRERGFYHFTVVDAQVEPVKYLYDEGCLPLKEQIHNWVVESFTPTKKRIKRESVKKMSKNQSSFDAPTSGAVPEGVDPRGVMDEIKRLGILTVTANDGLPLSKESHRLEGLPSKSLSWNPVSNTLLDKTQEKTELELYILGHFQSALSMTREEETAYSNEIEYLITGKSSDYDCLERVAKEIVALRLPINTASIMKDSSKKGEAGVAAGIICAITVQPEIYELGKTTADFNGIILPIYDRERTICDCFKYRSRLDNEIFNKALNAYANDPQKELRNLSKYAKKLRVHKKVTELMEVLLNG